jgi:hypothetical protein
MRRALILATLVELAMSGCGPKRIPGTTIEDTKDNKAILEILGKYKQGLENHDTAAIMELVSAHFYETAGTADPSDDYDYKGLEQNLEHSFEAIGHSSLDMEIRKVEVDEDKAVVNYYFVSRYQMADAGYTSGFKVNQDIAQVRLKKEDGTWKITSGI